MLNEDLIAVYSNRNSIRHIVLLQIIDDQTIGNGTVLGCGYTLMKKTIFFTLNGTQIG
jgi:hypothetical protein